VTKGNRRTASGRARDISFALCKPSGKSMKFNHLADVPRPPGIASESRLQARARSAAQG
jgi:hypothetical protein